MRAADRGGFTVVRAAGDDAVEMMNKGFLWSLAVSRERVWEENDSGAHVAPPEGRQRIEFFFFCDVASACPLCPGPDTERGCVMTHRHYWLIAAVPAN